MEKLAWKTTQMLRKYKACVIGALTCTHVLEWHIDNTLAHIMWYFAEWPTLRTATTLKGNNSFVVCSTHTTFRSCLVKKIGSGWNEDVFYVCVARRWDRYIRPPPWNALVPFCCCCLSQGPLPSTSHFKMGGRRRRMSASDCISHFRHRKEIFITKWWFNISVPMVLQGFNTF